MGLFNWIFGKHPPRPPDPQRSVEAAWLPMWQAQLVVHELTEREIPAVVSEDHASRMIGMSREPMARIFVMEPLLAAAKAAIEEITGHPPARHEM